MEPIVLAILLLLALVIALLFFQDTGSTLREGFLRRYAFSFDPATNPRVKRKVTIIAPPQTINEEKYAVVVEALPLPADPPSAPPDGKGIKQLIAGVIHPEVHTKEGSKTLSDFDPPLLVRIEFTPDDGNAVPPPGLDGLPHLSLITFYPVRAASPTKGDNWRWQKLEPEDDYQRFYERNTLTGKLSTLTPADPIGIGEV